MNKHAGGKRQKELKKLGKRIYKLFKTYPSKPFTRTQVIKRFKNVANSNDITKALFHLAATDLIHKTKDNKFSLNQAKREKSVARYVDGVVDMAPSGVAYILVDGMEDVRVEKAKTNKALNGDKVKVGLYAGKKDKRPRGEVIEILERNQEFFVGRVQMGPDYAFVLPDNRNMTADFFVNKKNINGAEDGQKVIVKMLGWPEKNRNPDGEIVEILGGTSVHDVEMKSILIDHNFPLKFPDNVKREMDSISEKITDAEIAKRHDIRDVLTFTIDPVDAKDFDDAISYKELSNGHMEIGVHIADVSHYVKPNTALDKQAFRRATSVYLVDRVLPMLPEKLSNVICSLRPQEEKLCFSAFFEIDDEGKVYNSAYKKTVIFSDHRFTYDGALEEIQSGEGKFGKPLKRINELAKKIRTQRYANGAIDFDSREIRFSLNMKGDIEAVKAKERHDAHYLIEELMLLANKSVAKFISEKKLGKQAFPFVYRIHDEPDPEKLTAFRMNAADYGHFINTDNLKKLPFELNAFFAKIKGKPEQDSLEGLAIRSMAKAIYTTDNIGHYGLHFTHYSHFTSPIRRYPDVLVHRLLNDYLETKSTSLKKERLEEQCGQCNKMERKAVEAERESIKYFQTVFMKDKVGQEFNGFVSGVTSWGFYVELEDIHTEGLVRISELDDDVYIFDERKKQIIGHNTKRIFKMGDKVRVFVEAVNVEKRQIDLLWVSEEN